jgi:hypothetical protein
MKEYHKINSLYKRHKGDDPNVDKALKNKLIIGDYAQEEFGVINKWIVEEKVDGTNIRIHYTVKDGVPSIVFGGRTSNAQIPAHLFNYLQTTFTLEKLQHFEGENVDVVLYGEGIGPKINGNIYKLEECKFVLFDVRVGHFWLKREDVYAIAKALGVLKPVRIVEMNEQEIVEFCRNGTVKGVEDPYRVPQSKLFLDNAALTLEEFERCFTVDETTFKEVINPETGEIIEEARPILNMNFPVGKMTSIVPPDIICMEGVVCRANPELLDRAGHRIIWKLKHKDLV